MLLIVIKIQIHNLVEKTVLGLTFPYGVVFVRLFGRSAIINAWFERYSHPLVFHWITNFLSVHVYQEWGLPRGRHEELHGSEKQSTIFSINTDNRQILRQFATVTIHLFLTRQATDKAGKRTTKPDTLRASRMRVPENTLDNYRWIFLHVPLSLRSFHLSVRQTLGTVKTLLFGDAISRNLGAITTQIYLTPGVAAEAVVTVYCD